MVIFTYKWSGNRSSLIILLLCVIQWSCIKVIISVRLNKLQKTERVSPLDWCNSYSCCRNEHSCSYSWSLSVWPVSLHQDISLFVQLHVASLSITTLVLLTSKSGSQYCVAWFLGPMCLGSEGLPLKISRLGQWESLLGPWARPLGSCVLGVLDTAWPCTGPPSSALTYIWCASWKARRGRREDHFLIRVNRVSLRCHCS